MIITLANCGLKPCPEVPLWLGIPLGLIGLAGLVVTIWDLFGKGPHR